MSTITIASILLSLLFSISKCDTVSTGEFLLYNSLNGQPYNVTYDERSFIINGERTLLLGGSVHYPRFSPAQWPSIMQKALDDGLNHLEVYIFWNLHEPAYDFSGKHVFNYEGRANLTQFLQVAMDIGIFINLRIGPYACAEWSFGGVPTWILHDPDVVMRSSNANWENYMKTFVDEISNVARPFLAKYGGPIILAQIENEYHGNDKTYVSWCGELAESQNFDIPWVMCNGESANNTINTCNGNNCYGYAQSHSKNFPGQPLGWTENEGWFEYWTKEYNPDSTEWDDRSPSDMAQSVAIWFGAGGAHHNYYMWMGGNHVRNFAGSSIANYYADGVNYHADGLPHEPKRNHLQILHNILAQHQVSLLSNPIQIGNEIAITPVGQTKPNSNTFAYQYKVNDGINNDELIFLVNIDTKNAYILPWNGINYNVPVNSISLLNNQGTEIYNTDKVSSDGLPTKRVYNIIYTNLSFSSYSEPIPLPSDNNIRPDDVIINKTPLEQIRLTNDTYEYVYYSTDITINSSNPINNGSLLIFTGRAANAYNIYMDDKYIGQVWNGAHTSESINYQLKITDNISFGKHTLTVISSSLGIDNYNGIKAGDKPDQCDKKGITGDIYFAKSNKEMLLNITDNGWNHWIGTTGEVLNIYASGSNKVKWISPALQNNGVTWFKTTFRTPAKNILDSGVILIDIGNNSIGVNRGHFYINGYDMGHYNNNQINGLMIQRYYFIPTDYLIDNQGVNTLLFLEEYPNTQINKVSVVSSTVIIPQ